MGPGLMLEKPLEINRHRCLTKDEGTRARGLDIHRSYIQTCGCGWILLETGSLLELTCLEQTIPSRRTLVEHCREKDSSPQ